MKSKILAVNGFMGLASDWNPLGFEDTIEPWILPGSDKNFAFWADALNNEAIKKKERPFALGYSFGGRLVLHAIVKKPELWKGVIIVSAHPGLVNVKEKEERLEKDREWAEKFRTMAWDKLMEEWNSQPVFSRDRFKFDRVEFDFDRNKLADQIVAGSLGKQENLREKIAQVPMPILWIVGERDQKYCDIASDLTFLNKQSMVVMMPMAGHRVLWEQPEACHVLIDEFIRKIL